MLLPAAVLGSRTRQAETAEQLDLLLAARIAALPAARLVDREELKRVTNELQLGESGLVESATAQRIGHLVGARRILQPTYLELDGQRMLSTKAIDVETGEVRIIEAAVQKDAGLGALSDAAATQLAPLFVSPPGRQQAHVADPRIAALRADLAGNALPRIAVRVPETHLGTVVPDPAGETEIIHTLRSLGFTVIDTQTLAAHRDSADWMNLLFERVGGGGGRLGLRQGVERGTTIAHNSDIAKLKTDADLLLVGEAFSEYTGDLHGFRSCQARVELRAINTATGEVAIADGRHGKAADLGEFAAGKKALRAAGQDIALAVAPLLASYWTAHMAAAE